MQVHALLQAANAVPGALSTATQVAMVVLGAAAALGILTLVFFLYELRATYKEVRRAARAVEKRIDPVVERSRTIAANVEFVTAALRTDVERMNASVRALSDRLQQASDRMEERIEEFNALMEVVQGEAEDVFLDTASTVRGIKAGAGRLTGHHDAERIESGDAPED